MLANAGASMGLSKMGRRVLSINTPRMMMTVVTIELTAMAMVDKTSPSSVPGLYAGRLHGVERAGHF